MRSQQSTSPRTGPGITLVVRVLVATVLFYAVAVLYAGTSGEAGADVFVQPMVGTAVFAGVLGLPMLAVWIFGRRTVVPENAS